MGQDRVGPNSKILASRSSSGLGRTNGGGLARAVGVYGCLRDLLPPRKEPLMIKILYESSLRAERERHATAEQPQQQEEEQHDFNL